MIGPSDIQIILGKVRPLSTPPHRGSSTGSDHCSSIGVVEAVVSIPAFAFPNVGIATNLWLLRGRSAVLREAVLVVNGAAFADGGRGARQSFREEAIDKIVNIVQSWRSERLVQTEAHIAMAVPVEVIDPASGIDPQAVLEAPPIEDDICPDPPGHLMSHLTLGGFKSFGPKVTVPLAPLTLVFGANSAGKSTIVQSLLLLRQSLQSRGLVTQGPDANVGSIAGAAHKHASDEVCLGFGFSAPMWELPSAGTPDPSLPREIEFRFAAGPGQRGELRLMRTKFGQHDVTLTPFSDREEFALRFAEVRDVFEELALGTLLYPFDTRQARSDNPGEEANRSRQRRNHGRSIHRRAAVDELRLRGEGLLPTGRIVDDVNTSRTSERSSSVLKSYADRMARLAAGVGVEAQTILASLTHLGPLRSAPRRFYDRGGGAVPGDGRDVALFLFDNSAITEHVNQWLTTLEVPYLLDVLPVQVAGISDLVGDLVALTLTDSRSKVTVTPADVGFGISQVLPIVVELLAKTESLICVEQPETHLHPRLQARLADLFIESTSLAGRRNQLIVETHSEHLMLRVQRRIREGVVSPEQVKVLYVDQDEDGVAYVKPLRLDERGDFMDEWPAGFFDERLDDLIGGLL
ncbi:DUF3696 domain-containing protein [Gordonia amicalis]|nr:DUF3696 domain-containing protein [Gordonia amicalis]